MTNERAPSKAELLADLRSSGDEALTRLCELPAARLDQGRYENGWNGRQILAHIASIEWTYPRMLEIPSRTPVASGDQSPDGETPTHAARGGIDAYNQRQVERRAAASVAELLAEFERNRAATIAAVEAVDESLLATPIQSAGGRTGPLALVFHQVAVGHVRGHLADILGSG